jgi:uncharacterized protein YunC (DUF1805 family)
MKVEDVILDDKGLEKAIGYEIELGTKKLIIIKAKKGYIACGYIDKQVAEKFEDIAVFVTGVKNIDDMLTSEIVDLTTFAEKIGLKKGQLVKDALKSLI